MHTLVSIYWCVCTNLDFLFSCCCHDVCL